MRGRSRLAAVRVLRRPSSDPSLTRGTTFSRKGMKARERGRQGSMRIATWNINGVKARIDNLRHWLTEASPDVVCLQEIKSVDEAFPTGAIEDLGYNVAVHGQKGFNGVALLSKHRIEDVQRGLPPVEGDSHARFIIRPDLDAGRRGTRRLGLHAERQSDRHGQVYLQACLARTAAGLGARRARARGAARHRRRLTTSSLTRSTPNIRNPGSPTPSTSRSRRRPSAGYPRSASPTRCARWTTAAASTRSGTTRPAPGRRTTASASTTSCSRRKPPTASSMAGVDRHVRTWEKPSDHVPVWVELG